MVEIERTYQGFTLIEMIVVIVIIGILALIAVSSYGSARQSAQINVALESVMSLIKQQKGNAQTGRQEAYSTSTSPQTSCFGLIFNIGNTTSAAVQTFSVPYAALSPNSSTGLADYCDTTDVSKIHPVDVQDIKGIILDSLYQGSSKISDPSFYLLFKPPFGSVLEATNTPAFYGDQQSLKTNSTQPLEVNLKLQNDPSNRILCFQYDAISGVLNQTCSPSSATQQ